MQSNGKTIKITAKTLKKAMLEASVALSAPEENIEYRLISQTKGGLFSFIGRKVEIEAWDNRSPSSSKPKKFRMNPSANANFDNVKPITKPSFSNDEIEEIKQDIKEYCAGICKYLVDSDVPEIETIEDGSRFILNILDEELGVQLTKNLKIAESIEHILRKKPKHIKSELPFRIFVDVNGIRQQREGDLIEMAQDLSEKVHGNKRPIVLNYKSSYDRKIIHMALDKDDRVYTKSIGVGNSRKLMILPVKKRDKEQRAN